MHLVGILERQCIDHIVMELVVFVAADGLYIALSQVNVVNFARLIELVSNVVGLNHLKGNGIKTLRLGIPVLFILGVDLLIVLNVLSHGVAAVIPHVLIVHGDNAVSTAQLIDHCLRHWIQAAIG